MSLGKTGTGGGGGGGMVRGRQPPRDHGSGLWVEMVQVGRRLTDFLPPPPPPPRCLDTGLSKHGAAVFPHFWVFFGTIVFVVPIP